MMFSPYKLIGYVLAPLGVFTIVGAGFALWSFLPADSLEPTNVSVNVTDLVKQGAIQVVNAPHILVLSQGSENDDDLFDGINFYSKADAGTGESNDQLTYPNDELTFRYYNDEEFLTDATLSTLGYNLNLGVSLFIHQKDGATIPLTKYISLSDDWNGRSEAISETDQNRYFTEGDKSLINGKEFVFVKGRTNSSSNAGLLGFRLSGVTTNTNYDSNYVPSTDPSIPSDITKMYESYIEISTNLNPFFRYQNSDVKPTTVEKYNALNNDMTGSDWHIDIELVSYFSETI